MDNAPGSAASGQWLSSSQLLTVDMAVLLSMGKTSLFRFFGSSKKTVGENCGIWRETSG